MINSPVEVVGFKPIISITDFITDSNYMGDSLQLFPMQRKILAQFWSSRYQVGVWCLGRRSGKTFMAALSAVYACIAYAPLFRSHLREGENFYVLFVANNREQATIALRQVKLFLNQSALLSQFVTKDNATSVELNNGGIFKVLPNASEGVRGYSASLVILDEAAHFGTGGNKKKTGEQLLQSIEPAIAQFGSWGRVLMISTPWDKQGIFFTSYAKALSGKHPEIYAANYPTWKINPTIPKSFLLAAKKRDPIMFQVEYGANFAVDFAAFLDADTVLRSVVLASEGMPNPKHNYYLALDPAMSGDAYTACIGHIDDGILHIDLFHEFVPSFNGGKKKSVDVEKVETWIMAQHKRFRFRKIVLDQYQSQATIQRLQKLIGVSQVNEFTWTYKSKTESYSYLKELFNSDKVALYRHETAIAQLINLQVFYLSGGRWSVSGGKGIKVDDYCSVLAAIANISRTAPRVGWARFA